MAALRIHQHGVDDSGRASISTTAPSAGPAHRRVAALEHDAFDRLGIVAGAGRGRIGARGGEFVPGGEWHQRREIDARIVEPRDECFEPRAPLGERQLAQILVAVDQQIVGAQMRGKFAPAASA